MRTLNNGRGTVDGTVQLSSLDISIISAGLALFQAEVRRASEHGASPTADRLLTQLAALQAALVENARG